MMTKTPALRALCLLAACPLACCTASRPGQSTTAVSAGVAASVESVPAPDGSEPVQTLAEFQRRFEEARRLEEQQEAQDRVAYQGCLAQEERDTCASVRVRLLTAWTKRIAGQITRAWVRPPGPRSFACLVQVTQKPDGHVSAVSFGPCDDNAALRASLEAAVDRASPLPPAPDPSLFDAHLSIQFGPTP